MRFPVLAVTLLLAGCAAPAEPEAATEEPTRQSRPAFASGEVEPSPEGSWRGTTPARICVLVMGGCTGVSQYSDWARSFRLPGNATEVRVVVTWAAVQEDLKTLELRAFDDTGLIGKAIGQSPLELTIDAPPERVSVLVDAVTPPWPAVRNHPQQPFDGAYVSVQL